MGEIDQLSMLIGEIQADLKEGARQRTAIFAKLDKIDEAVTQQGGQIMLLGQQMTQAGADHVALKKTISDTVMPAIEDYKTKKNRILGWAAGLGIGSGAGAGTLITKLFGAN